MTAKIVIASTLKPVWDPRAYEKIGQSLAATGLYEITIIGSGQAPSDSGHVSFLSHDKPDTLFKRLVQPLKILKQLGQIKPQLLIITTHELILPAVLLKLIHRTKLIYDVQENYNYNLRYQGIYPPVIRHLMAWYIRTKEIVFHRFFSLFILAEECYLDEIVFLKKHQDRCLVLENKCGRLFEKKDRGNSAKIELLLSGTISEIYGVHEALDFYENLPADEFTLTIIGHCPSQSLREELSTRAASLDGVHLQISAQPIAHEEIGNRYSTKTIGLLPYRTNKSIENKVPTKLFEYLAHEIPVLISPNPTWEKIIRQYGKGYPINFKETANPLLLSITINSNTRTNNLDLEELMWKSSEKEFLNAVEKDLTI